MAQCVLPKPSGRGVSIAARHEGRLLFSGGKQRRPFRLCVFGHFIYAQANMAGTLWGRNLASTSTHVYKRVRSIPSVSLGNSNNLMSMPLYVLVYLCTSETPFHGGDTGSIPVRDAKTQLCELA